MSAFFNLTEVNEARASIGLPLVTRRKPFKAINVYAKLSPVGLYYLATTTLAGSCREAKEMYALSQPRAGYAASDLIARYV